MIAAMVSPKVAALAAAADAYRETCKTARAAEIAASEARVTANAAEIAYRDADALRAEALENLTKAAGGTYFDQEKLTLVYPT